MAGLFLLREGDPDGTAAALATARATFARQGLAATAFRLPGWAGLHAPYAEGGPAMFHADGDDLAAVAGTFAMDGRTGTPALAALIAAADRLEPGWNRMSGHFVALVRRRGRTWLFGDRLGAFQLFRLDDRCFSTSFMAAAEQAPRLRFDAQGVYDWAFNVTALGDDTVLEQVRLLPAGAVVELTRAGLSECRLSRPLPAGPDRTPLPERIERHRAALDRVLAPHLDAGAPVHAPLSGGLDSRLLLAMLRRRGAAASVYVYGPPGDADVRIATGIGDALGFPVRWTDKGAAAVTPDAFAEVVARNFDAMDALPTFGNIFDNGGHLSAQDDRHAGGWPAASGGGGEVYRDFFYLPDRPFTADAVARTFFARFVASDATALFDPHAFIARTRDRILHAVERPGDHRPLSRATVEQVYPRFRCRALFGREISLEARRSPYLMPFLEEPVIAEAATLPAGLRHAGRFQSALLAAIDPALAAQPSAYGHHFAGPPGRRHRFDEWSTRARPIWLRRHSYALHRRLRPMADEHGGLLDPDHLGRVIDLDYPAMRRFFRMDRIRDDGVRRRIACLEYLAARLGSRLVR